MKLLWVLGVLVAPLWAQASGGYNPARQHELEQRNRDVVAKLLPALDADRDYKMQGTIPSQCSGTTFQYTARRNANNTLGIDLSVGLYFQKDDFSDSEATALVQRYQNCKPSVEALYLRNGVALKLNIMKADDDNKWHIAYDHIVWMHPGPGRDNSGEYYAGDEASEVCPVFAHEVGHLLGLPDEYSEDNTCRSPRFEFRGEAAMNLMAGRGYDYADIYPHHVRMLFEEMVPRTGTLHVDLPSIEKIKPAVFHTTDRQFEYFSTYLNHDGVEDRVSVFDERQATATKPECSFSFAQNRDGSDLPKVDLPVTIDYTPTRHYDKDTTIERWEWSVHVGDQLPSLGSVSCNAMRAQDLVGVWQNMASDLFTVNIAGSSLPAIEDDELPTLERWLRALNPLF